VSNKGVVMESECRGCNMYNIELKGCDIGIISYVSETKCCPCLDCLMKGICQNACENYEHYLVLSDEKRGIVGEDNV